MLLVKTYLAPSKIHGIGLFAAEPVTKGTITWRFDSKFDLYFNPAEVNMMPELQRNLIENYAYLSKKTNKYIYSIDNTRFTNHSSHPNINNTEVLPGDSEVYGVANRDIEIGEELTIDYRLVDINDSQEQEEYLKI